MQQYINKRKNDLLLLKHFANAQPFHFQTENENGNNCNCETSAKCWRKSENIRFIEVETMSSKWMAFCVTIKIIDE